MTETERKALVERLRQPREAEIMGGLSIQWEDGDALDAADQIEADGQRIAELKAALNGLLDEITLNKGDVLDSRAAGMAYAALLLGGKG